jgi:hypothetical protein
MTLGSNPFEMATVKNMVAVTPSSFFIKKDYFLALNKDHYNLLYNIFSFIQDEKKHLFLDLDLVATSVYERSQFGSKPHLLWLLNYNSHAEFIISLFKTHSPVDINVFFSGFFIGGHSNKLDLQLTNSFFLLKPLTKKAIEIVKQIGSDYEYAVVVPMFSSALFIKTIQYQFISKSLELDVDEYWTTAALMSVLFPKTVAFPIACNTLNRILLPDAKAFPMNKTFSLIDCVYLLECDLEFSIKLYDLMKGNSVNLGPALTAGIDFIIASNENHRILLSVLEPALITAIGSWSGFCKKKEGKLQHYFLLCTQTNLYFDIFLLKDIIRCVIPYFSFISEELRVVKREMLK